MRMVIIVVFSILLISSAFPIRGEETPAPPASPSTVLSPVPEATKSAVRFAYVDLEKVFRGYYKTEKTLSQLEDNLKKKEAEMEKLVEEIKKMREEIKDTQLLLNDSTRLKKEKEIEEKTLTLKQLEREVRLEMSNQALEEKEKLLEDIQKKVEEKARAGGYTFIFRGELLLFKDASLDLTQEIIRELNQGQEK